MNPVIMPDVYELVFLQSWNAHVSGTLTLRLFNNNITPSASSVLGDFTEADFNGYASSPITLNTPIEVSGKANCVSSAASVFSFSTGTGPNTIYGWYLEDTNEPEVVCAQRFDSPITIALPGDQIVLLPTVTLFSQF